MTKGFLLNSLKGLVAPIVRICLRHGIKLGELIDAIKRVYVECAEETLEKNGEAVSTSRITLMTGVHRTDVSAIREERSFTPQEHHTASNVISQWRYDQRFSSKAGKPRVLDSEGKQSEFAQLVKSVSLSVSPYTVLFELERLGMVSKSKDGKVTLLTKAYVPKGEAKAVLEMLSEDAIDLYDSVAENAFTPSDKQAPHHHLKTEFTSIPTQYYPKIQSWLMKEASNFHDKVRNYLSRFDRDITPGIKGEGKYRIAFTSFSHSQDCTDDTKSMKIDEDKK